MSSSHAGERSDFGGGGGARWPLGEAVTLTRPGSALRTTMSGLREEEEEEDREEDEEENQAAATVQVLHHLPQACRCRQRGEDDEDVM